MKKRWIQLVLILGLMALTCVAAQAAESPTSGLRKLTVESKYRSTIISTFVPLDANGQDVQADPTNENVFPGAAQVRLTYRNPQKDKEYLLIVLSDDEKTPSVDNMAYIDQKNQTAAGANGLEFTIYPKRPTSNSVTYSVYMSSDGDDGVTSYEKVASFEYYSTGLDVMLGDLDDNKQVEMTDALMLLQYLAELLELDDRQMVAANVDKSQGDPDMVDALFILQYLADLIPSFDDL